MRDLKKISKEKKVRKKRLPTSLASKKKHAKLFSSKLLDGSGLLMRTIKDIRNSIFLAALRSIY